MLKILVTLTLIFHIKFCSSFVADDLITDLPGVNFKLNFKQYSGYLQPDNESYLHYW